VYKEEYQKNGISSWKCNSSDDIDRLGHSNRMGWLFFTHLDEAGLEGRWKVVSIYPKGFQKLVSHW